MVVIVGRPNVGKSALFNRLIQRRHCLVDATPGLTRDRIYGDVSWRGVTFRIVDTGGLIFSRQDRMQEAIASQVGRAMEEAGLALLVCDGRQGVVPLDREVAEWLRRWGKPVLVVSNKVDTDREIPAIHEFSALGLSDPMAVSSLHGLGVGELLDAVLDRLHPRPVVSSGTRIHPGTRPSDGLPDPIGLAVIGRPNVGKSSLINRILNEERVLVDAEPGTTRDPVETPFSYRGRRFQLIDTAGIRPSSALRSKIDWLSRMKALEVMNQAHLCLGVLDAGAGLIRDDLRVLDHAVTMGRPLCLAVNKWDLIPRSSDPHEVSKVIARRAPFLRFAPVVCTSAKSGFQIRRLLETILEVVAQAYRRLNSEECLGLLEALRQSRSAPVGVRNTNWSRLIQVGVGPPIFHLTGKTQRRLSSADMAFLDRLIRERAGFVGTPLHLRILRDRR